MKVQLLGINGSWREVANSARTTVGQEAGEGEPSSMWKRRILLAEHSPIRRLHISWKWLDLLSWVSVHFVRHKFGIDHWVRTQRSDRTGINRNELTQSQLIEHECEANPQAIINISRKRLCKLASPETREAWIAFLDLIKEEQPELYKVCVPDCVYRGWCYEFSSCYHHLSMDFQFEVDQYRKDINGWR